MRRALVFLRRKWSRTSILFPRGLGRGWVIALASLVLTAPAMAGDLNLPTARTDLTPKDLARVEAITKPTNDFSKPEQFELMQGGAGTSKKRPNQDAFSQSSGNITF